MAVQKVLVGPVSQRLGGPSATHLDSRGRENSRSGVPEPPARTLLLRGIDRTPRPTLRCPVPCRQGVVPDRDRANRIIVLVGPPPPIPRAGTP
jgi:hypothetical protein